MLTISKTFGNWENRDTIQRENARIFLALMFLMNIINNLI